MDDFWADDLNKKIKEHTLEVKFKRQKSKSDLHQQDEKGSQGEHDKHHFRHSYIIKFNNIYRILWDIFMIMLAIQNCTLIPVEVAFKTHYEHSKGYMFIDWFVDIMFLFDIFFNFRTTMVKNGIELDDPKQIAKRYALSI